MNRLAQWTVKIQTILSHFCKQSKIVPLVIARQHREREKIKNKAKLFIVTKRKNMNFKLGEIELRHDVRLKSQKSSRYLYT